MFRYRRLFRCRVRHSCTVAVAFLSISAGLGRGVSPNGGTCLRIEHVGNPPGVWSGVFASKQWLEATVLKTSQKDLRLGQHVRFGIYILSGNKLMDKSEPGLNPAMIHPGTRITISPHCAPLRKDGVVYDPQCIALGCPRSIPASADLHPGVAHIRPPLRSDDRKQGRTFHVCARTSSGLNRASGATAALLQRESSALSHRGWRAAETLDSPANHPQPLLTQEGSHPD
jgi:hypothetical protein